MAIVLNVDSADPGRLAANLAPRLAALLMDAFQRGQPVQVTAHAANAGMEIASVFSPADPLSQWVELANVREPAQELLPAPARHVGAPEAAPAPSGAAMSPVAAIYRRLLGEVGPMHRLRTSNELLEAAKPAPAGVTAAAARQNVEAHVDRETELVRIAALVVSAGFGLPAVGGGAGSEFEAIVLRNVGLAADVVAPGKPLGGLSVVELQAIVTATMHSSTGAFLSQFGSTPRGGTFPRLVMDALKSVPDAAKVAAQFNDQGAFSQAKFLEAASGMGMHPSQVLAATPVGLKMALIGVAAQKASVIVQQVLRGIRDYQVERRLSHGGQDEPEHTQRHALAEDETTRYEDVPKPAGA